MDASAELARIDRTARRIRLAVGLAAVALGLAAISVSVVLTSLLPQQTVHAPGSWIPMILSLLTVTACVMLALAARSDLARHRVPVLVPEVERSAGLRRGELAGALELSSGAPIESQSLAQFGRQLVADKIAGHEDWELLPETLRRVGQRISWAALVFVVASGGLVVAAMRSPARTLAAATALGQPWSTTFPPPPPRIHIVPGDTAVMRGERLEVQAMAPMRDSVLLVWQPVGEPKLTARLSVAADGRAVGVTSPIEAPTRFWVEAADGSSSQTYAVVPLDPLLVTEMSIELTYPAYLQRPAESLGLLAGVMEIPVGTVIRILGRTNEPLRRVRLVGAEAGVGVVEFEVEGRRFSVEWRPRNNGIWRWALEPVSELPGIRSPESVELRIVADLVPHIDVVYPGRDTAASVDLRLPMVIDARDDIGLTMVDLETWRVSASGVNGLPQIVPLWQAPAAHRQNLRVVLRPILRLDILDLVPGDTLFYVARARDGHPSHAWSESDTFRVFIPSMTELHRSAAGSAAELAERSRELKDDAAALARASRDAQRRSEGRQVERSGGAPDASEFGATEEARRVLERGQELDQRIADVQRRMDELRDGAEDSGLVDASMREKLAQLEELFRQIEETGLGEKLRQLREALKNLDARQTRRELGDLSSKLREMEARLEQTLALLERVSIEQTMIDATDSAEQLASRQTAMAEAFRQNDSWADREAEVVAEADRLAMRLDALRDQLIAQGLDAAADSIARGVEQMSVSAADMQTALEAARSSSRSGSQRGQSSAAQASAQMQGAAETIESAAEMLSADWKQEALEAVGRAMQEALDLAREQASLSTDLSQDRRKAADLAGRQASIVQGLDRLLESLSTAGRKTALIDRRVGSTAAEVREQMQELGESFGGRDGPPRGAGAESLALVENLNDLAAQLMASRRAVEASGSATGMQEALDQLARMSQSQAGLNRESGGLMLMQQNGQAMEVALQRLAERQAEIARQLEHLAERPEAEELPARPELLAVEADAIARDLRAGQLDQNTLRRQERLFRRLLDAGRSLERDEDPQRRESRAADLSRAGFTPDPRPDIATGPRFPYPDEEDLRAASRSERRLILDYFDRLNAADGGTP